MLSSKNAEKNIKGHENEIKFVSASPHCNFFTVAYHGRTGATPPPSLREFPGRYADQYKRMILANVTYSSEEPQNSINFPKNNLIPNGKIFSVPCTEKSSLKTSPLSSGRKKKYPNPIVPSAPPPNFQAPAKLITHCQITLSPRKENMNKQNIPINNVEFTLPSINKNNMQNSLQKSSGNTIYKCKDSTNLKKNHSDNIKNFGCSKCNCCVYNTNRPDFGKLKRSETPDDPNILDEDEADIFLLISNFENNCLASKKTPIPELKPSHKQQQHHQNLKFPDVHDQMSVSDNLISFTSPTASERNKASSMSEIQKKNPSSLINISSPLSFSYLSKNSNKNIHHIDNSDSECNGEGDYDSIKSTRGNFKLLNILFHADMIQGSYPCRMIRDLGEEEVMQRHIDLLSRFGARRLNRDDFHYHIIEILKAPQLTINRRDTDMMFDMFDTSLNGYVDRSEMRNGVRWVVHGEREIQRIVAAYCKQFITAKNLLDTVVTLIEIQLMLKAVINAVTTAYSSEKYNEIRDDKVEEIKLECKNLLEAITESSRSGEIPYPLFIDLLKNNKTVYHTILQIDGTGVINPEIIKSHVSDNVSFYDSEYDLDNPSSGDNSLLNASARPINNIITKVTPSGTKKLGGILLDLTHPRFKADVFRVLSSNKPTNEHDNPKWILRNGILWLSNPPEEKKPG